jgi:hypothetical protein
MTVMLCVAASVALLALLQSAKADYEAPGSHESGAFSLTIRGIT